MNNQEILEQLKECVIKGKVDLNAPYPPNMKGQNGADELTKNALDLGVSPELLLNQSLIPAMDVVGSLFNQKKIFVPQMLISAKAMSAGMKHLKPFFQSGEVKLKGTFIICTVAGDLHDIGKNLVSMIVEGAGFKVIDLGVDVRSQTLIEEVKNEPDAIVGLSALLTTTMGNMKELVVDLKNECPNNQVIIGGAPVSEQFKNEIGADAYADGPQGAVSYLNTLI
jgi:5-methyltetrahydrofolate--homocysteine methyltransferase